MHDMIIAARSVTFYAVGTLVIRLADLVDDDAAPGEDTVYMLKQPPFTVFRLRLQHHLNTEELFSGLFVKVEGFKVAGRDDMINVTSVTHLSVAGSAEPHHPGRLLGALPAGAPIAPQSVVTEIPTLYIIAKICNSPAATTVQVTMGRGICKGSLHSLPCQRLNSPRRHLWCSLLPC